jgi:hypothetical protein
MLALSEGRKNWISNATPTPTRTPAPPPISVNVIASSKNCHSTSRRRAPTALRNPIFGYAAVGAALRPIGKQYLREVARPVAATGLLFAAGAFLGMLALSLVARALRLRLGEPGDDVVRHMITMVVGGLFIGAVIGLVTAPRITKRLRQVGPATPG